MVWDRLIGLVITLIGIGVFLIPQRWVRTYVKRWRDAYTFLFWVVRLAAFTAVVIGVLILLGPSTAP